MARWQTAWRARAAVLVVAIAAAVSGCALTPRTTPDETVFDDRLFGPPSERIGAGDLFELSPAMRAYLDARIAPAARQRGGHAALIDALYSRGMLKLEYDSAYTRNAHEAFEARMGNCLSLVIMTAAFAREMGLQVRFQDVRRVFTWDRSGDLHFLIGHVNLMLGPAARNGNWISTDAGRWLIIDFLPGQNPARQVTRAIGEERIRAMFMNNRAAEALTSGRLADAYWWARGAFAQDRSYANTFNTLGVIYRRHGATAAAERALRHAIELDGDNLHAMANLVPVLADQGRSGEAELLAAELRRRQPAMPYELFKQGQQAMRDGDFRRARDLFEREIDNVADNHEFHFWLALAHLELGDAAAARRHLRLAVENSPTQRQQSAYAAKLQKLNAPTTN